MSERKYIGARYVPLFANPLQWDNTRAYEPLTIVLNNGNSYTSRQYVPIGIDISNSDYWALSADYNAAIQNIDNIIPSNEFSSANTVKDYIDGGLSTVDAEIDALAAKIPDTDFTSTNTVKDYIDSEIQSVSDVLPASDFSSANTVKDYVDAGLNTVDAEIDALVGKNMFCRIIEVSNIASLSVPNDTYAQGATSDGTYIYVFYAPLSDTTAIPALVKYNASTFETVSSLAFSSFANVGHGNSVEYDATTGVIIIYSSNRYITTIDPATMAVLKQYSVGSTANSLAVSQFCCNADYAAVNFSGSNTYAFYKRLANNVFGMYATADFTQGRGVSNWLQDCFMYQNHIVSISSVSTYDTFLSVFGVNATYSGTYRIIGLNKEIEGGFTINQNAYLVAADGTLYAFAMPNLDDIESATFINPNIERCFTRYVDANHYAFGVISSAGLFSIETGTTSNSSNPYSISRVIPDLATPFCVYINSSPERTSIYGFNEFNCAYVTDGSLRIRANVNGFEMHITYTKSGNHQYLKNFYLYKDGVSRSIGFAQNGSDFTTKFASLFDTSQDIHLELPTAQNFTLNVYGCNKLGSAYFNNYFIGILTS